MKKKQLDNVHTLVCQLCATLRDDTVSLTRLSDLLDCVIELARTGHTLEAISINREVMSFLAEGHSRSVHQARQKAWVDSLRNPSYTPPATYAYTQVKCEPPRPTATVEQMRAAADKAMMTEDNTYLCAGCGQKTLTDGEKPLGWSFNVEVDGEVYRALCAPCFGTGILKDYECNTCGETTSSRQHPPPHWVADEEGEGHLCSYCQEKP